MIEFWALAAAMMVVAILLVGVPLWRGTRRTGPDRDAVSVKLYRQRVAELQQDVDSGVVPEEDFEQARAELDRQLLDETAGAGESRARARRRRGRWAVVAVAVAVPVIGVGLYSRVGGMPWRSHAPKNLTQSQVQSMVRGLAQRLQNNPDDGQGWLMLGRSYLVMGRYKDAAKALTHAREILGDTPETLTDYAEALAMAGSTRSLAGKPEKLLNKALAMNGSFPKALWLAGVAAAQQGDYRTAIGHWKKLLAEQTPGSQGAKVLQKTIAQARKQMASGAGAGASGTAATPAAAAGKAVIRVHVALAGDVASRARADDPVYIYARPVGGSTMPVAVVRRKVSDLPTSVVLDDSSSMMQAHALSDYHRVSVAARVAVHGSAMARPGDLETKSETVPVDGKHRVSLVIDKVVKGSR
ncbi:MAG TPA: c-type cytochrome biogenesis protein CcmI [Gammaproteobacteria bacterium]|nr:c-type cytochrome biogenesis protein CcmI [Gammaproteobacteria bacterium]